MDCVDLSEKEAQASLEFLLRDGSEALISAFLVLLRAKGETFEEVSIFFVDVLRVLSSPCCRQSPLKPAKLNLPAQMD